MTKINGGDKAPNFSLKGLDRKDYALPELLERGPVVAAFFKISCPVCQFTFPFLERMYKKVGVDGVTFLAVSQDDARGSQDFARQYGVSFPIAPDEKGYPVSNAYGLTMVPTVFLIDTDGTVKVSSMGFNKSDLEKIALELAERKHLPRAPLFQPKDAVPEQRPG